MEKELSLCLLSILQRGITEARSLALSGNAKESADLLDAMDNIPRHLAEWSDESESEIHKQLTSFKESTPNHATDFLSILENRKSIL